MTLTWRNILLLLAFMVIMPLFAIAFGTLRIRPEFTQWQYLSVEPTGCASMFSYQDHFVCQHEGLFISGTGDASSRVQDSSPNVEYGDLVLRYGEPVRIREYRNSFTAVWEIGSATMAASVPDLWQSVDYHARVLWITFTL